MPSWLSGGVPRQTFHWGNWGSVTVLLPTREFGYFWGWVQRVLSYRPRRVSAGAGAETGPDRFPTSFFFDRGQSHPVLAQQADPQQPGGHHQPGGGAAEGPHLATLLRQVFRGAAPVSAVSSGLRGRSWCQELLCTELKSRRVERAPLWLFCSSLFGPQGWGECC